MFPSISERIRTKRSSWYSRAIITCPSPLFTTGHDLYAVLYDDFMIFMRHGSFAYGEPRGEIKHEIYAIR
jgi:hypothetical protein